MGLGKSKILSQAAAAAADSNFEPFIWTGNATERSVTGVGIAADMVWFKSRTQGNYNPKIVDTVRGLNGGTVMENVYTSLSNAQANDNGFRSLDADGFSVADSGDGNNDTINYVGWFFKGGGSSNIYNVDGTGYNTSAGAGLTSGTINPSGASVNTAAGFSIIEYIATGTTATVAHGLSSAPELILSKTTSAAYDWLVYAAPVGATKQMRLNATTGANTSGFMNNTAPTNSVYTVASGNNLNYANGDVNVAYCFHSVAGVQKVGSYTGNGSTTGTSVTTGFEPRFLLIKSSTSAGTNWTILDKARTPNNPMENDLKANSSAAEQTGTGNNYPQATTSATGFQVNTTDGAVNGSGETYIYLAIA